MAERQVGAMNEHKIGLRYSLDTDQIQYSEIDRWLHNCWHHHTTGVRSLLSFIAREYSYVGLVFPVWWNCSDSCLVRTILSCF